MDISKYTLEELLLTSIKGEIESRDLYRAVAERIDNPFLSDRLGYLAYEEEHHRAVLEGIYKQQYPDKPIKLPGSTELPMPDLSGIDESTPVREVFQKAMEAEKAAYEYYSAMADLFVKTNDKIRDMLMYLAVMEKGHYKLLELELEAEGDIGDVYRY